MNPRSLGMLMYHQAVSSNCRLEIYVSILHKHQLMQREEIQKFMNRIPHVELQMYFLRKTGFWGRIHSASFKPN
ncbi:hypothetical protein HNQ92_001712 [Rhabdobacter roseus]|uniref:Uncharacterized protein n=1 Tax=Rhabdobacter roseus TaxID=1655419 RepID=A0A840THF8_9BACT|nr:hypothetical protein [Rhabdobacter roseus]